MNHKRIRRQWREEALQRPTPKTGKRARAANESMGRHQAENPHVVKGIAFQFDATAEGRRLKVLM